MYMHMRAGVRMLSLLCMLYEVEVGKRDGKKHGQVHPQPQHLTTPCCCRRRAWAPGGWGRRTTRSSRPTPVPKCGCRFATASSRALRGREEEGLGSHRGASTTLVQPGPTMPISEEDPTEPGDGA